MSTFFFFNVQPNFERRGDFAPNAITRYSKREEGGLLRPLETREGHLCPTRQLPGLGLPNLRRLRLPDGQRERTRCAAIFFLYLFSNFNVGTEDYSFMSCPWLLDMTEVRPSRTRPPLPFRATADHLSFQVTRGACAHHHHYQVTRKKRRRALCTQSNTSPPLVSRDEGTSRPTWSTRCSKRDFCTNRAKHYPSTSRF